MARYIVKVFLKGIFPLFLMIFAVQPSHAQTDVLYKIKKDFDNYRKQTLEEKIYLQTDRSFYVAGEIIWFKAYCVDGTYNKPLDLSKIAYVEILDKEFKPVLQAKIGLRGGLGDGSLFIPFTIHSGNYRLRAYTSWMKNFSPDYFFEKDITIINTRKKLEERPVMAPQAYDIQFFPEGGNLVQGIESTVAFRVVDQNGHGVDFRGTLMDQSNNEVTLFGPHKFGMGHFRFTPKAGNTYSAVIKVGTSNAVVTPLPGAYSQGYVMHLDDADSSRLRIEVRTNTQDPAVYLFVHARQLMQWAEMKTLGNGMAEFLVDKKAIADGISTFTLFNYASQPVCERLYFKRPKNLVIDAATDRDAYAPRSLISVSLRSQEMSGLSKTADLSVAVVLADSLQQGDADNISSYLWLSADIPGRLESPQYYFNNPEEEVAEAVDDLMMTRGWRRFRWADLLQEKPPVFEFLPEYEGHIITGRLTNKKTGLPAENITAYLSSPGQHFRFGSAISNKNGQLQFDIKNLDGTHEIVLQPADPKDSINRIDILTPFSEKYSARPLPAFYLPSSLTQDLTDRSLTEQVQNTYLKEKLQQFDAPQLTDSNAFYGWPDRKYFLDDYTRFTTMEEVMREYVGLVTVHKRQQKFYFRMMNEPHQVYFEDRPLMMLDGVVFDDADKIINYDPLKVKKIEVVGRQYFLGPMVANGIISYSTYKGDLDGFPIDPSAVALDYEGLQLRREFFAPVYDTPSSRESRRPDFRNLLFWDPELKTDPQGFAKFSFYSSDRKGKYMVIIEGLTKNGLSGSKVLSFDVLK